MSWSCLNGVYSPWMKWMAIAVALAVFQPLLATAEEDEIVIHRGEEFTSPGVGPKEELRFVRVFTVSREHWGKQAKVHPLSKPPLSAAKALELAEASLEPSGTDGDDDVHVTKLELHYQPSGDPRAPGSSVPYYVVDFHVDGSEVQRLVLMDGTVLKPQLTRVPGKSTEPR